MDRMGWGLERSGLHRIDLRRIGLRRAEWLLVCFFLYLAIISPFFPARPNLGAQPWVAFGAVAILLWSLSRASDGRWARIVDFARDWLPLALTFLAFREMEYFVPREYNVSYETIWIGWDRVLFERWHFREVIESLGKALPFYFELCYVLVYGVGAYCVALLEGLPGGGDRAQRRRSLDRFWTAYLTGTLLAYALFPFFPTRPPRYAHPEVGAPLVDTWARHLNLFLLRKATIHVGVFPSAHVSSAFSSALGMLWALPGRRTWGWVLMAYAASVAVATVYGRYHYAVDALAGMGISVIAGIVCLCWKKLEHS